MQHFIYRRRVAYHETDAMAVVHHANHIKFVEEARVAWLRSHGLIEPNDPYDRVTFAVLKLSNQYFKPLIFEDEVEVWLQTRLLSPVRVEFQYALYCARLAGFAGVATTTLVPLSRDFKPSRVDARTVELFEREPWSETWPPTV